MGKPSAFRGAAATLVVFALLGQVLSKEAWETTVPQLRRASMRRHVQRERRSSSFDKAPNKTMAHVSTFALYPQLAEAAGCRQLIDDIAVPESWTESQAQRCTDAVCLVQAMLAKSPLIIIDQDIDVSGSLPLPDVTTKLVIVGRCPEHYPCMIDGMGAGRIFVVGIGGQLTLRDLEVRGGYCSDGAAVLVSGTGSSQPGSSGKLLALNVLFYNNTAITGNGGAIFAKAGGAVHVRSGVFDQNEAAMGGAVYVGGSDDNDPTQAGCGLSSCATFVNTAFTRNWADDGGAVYVDDATLDCSQNGSAKFECTNCNFQDNYALDHGGALLLAWKTTGAKGHVKFSSFLNNYVQAPGSGGAVELEEGRPWSEGAEFNSYHNQYSQSLETEIAVTVKAFANATFTHNRFLTHNAVACDDGGCQFCPDNMASSPVGQFWEAPAMAPAVPAPAPSYAMCPGPPPPLCEWVPPECTPWTAPMLPPPSPPPPPMMMPSPAPAPVVAAAWPPSPILTMPPKNAPPPGAIVQDIPIPPPPPPSCMCKCPAPAPRRGVGYGDPHFYGKHGEHFDFHGRSGRDYCVVTDKELQINMHLFQGLQKDTTFISMLGMLYKHDEILVNAQAHTNASRQWAVKINNVELLAGAMYENPRNGVNITIRAREVHIRASGAIDLTVSIVPATSGTRGSGANYLNFKIDSLSVSPSVHGLLGQSYQETKEAYKKLWESRRAGPSRAASVLLDGTADDYLTSGILASNCKFAVFEGGATSFAEKVHAMLTQSAHGLFPFTASAKLAAHGCTAVGDRFICSGGRETSN